MFKILKNILLSLLVTSYAFSMTEEEYNNHPFHNKSVLNEFISLSGKEEKLKIILEFIDFFLKGEELEVKQNNNKLSNKYIEEYFSVKKEYYKSFYKDENKYFFRASPLEYMIFTINYGYSDKGALIDNFINNPNREYLKFLYNYVIKYVKDANLIVGNFNYDIISDNEIYKKSNNILKNKINGLIRKVIVGDVDINSIVKYYFENNIDKNMNELAKLLNDNEMLFSFDYDRIIHSDKTKLKIVNISSKQCINIHSIRQITKGMSYHDLYILKLLEFFLRDFNEKQDEDSKKIAIPAVAEKPGVVEQTSEIDFREVSLPGATNKKETKIDKKTQKKIDEAQRNADKLIAEETKKNKNKNKKQPKPKPKAKSKVELNKEQEQKAKLKAEEKKQARIAAEQKAIEERKKEKEVRRKAQEARIAEKKLNKKKLIRKLLKKQKEPNSKEKRN